MNLQPNHKQPAINLDTRSDTKAELRTQKNTPISVSTPGQAEIGLSAEPSLASIELTAPGTSIEGEPYPGPYTVTPSVSRQTLHTKNYVATANITVEPIPSNYGRILWNGTTLTVY